MFSATGANFDGIPENVTATKLHVTKAVQKAFIEVTDAGIEAAAASGI